ncbi:MAG TPA: glycoside hydrolase family 31 protein [Bacteroidales bacterium]|nr:glycoside hydrolase family 31 protein [Bacteroidales bacterium]
MKRLLLILSVLLIIFPSCSRSRWELKDNGVFVRPLSSAPGIPRLMRIEVLDDGIIHVTAGPQEEFFGDTSLCVIGPAAPAPAFTAVEEADTLVISAPLVRVRVALADGQVTFRDPNGNVLLEEVPGGGKSFKRIRIEGTSGYTLGQVFSSPPDEAFYGLGQHQSDEFNYKRLNEILYQYNTKVSVPFIVSDKNYGLLWDNYSLTRFGDPRDYMQMDLFTLYDDEGKAGGLTASYYTEGDTARVFVRRTESSIDYENLETVKNFPEGFQFYNSTITWTGEIEPKETGNYHFKLYYAGYTKLWIGDELVVPERWRTAWNPNTYKFSGKLEQGKRYPVRLEWKPDGGISYIGLKALSPRPAEEQASLSLSSEMGDQIDYYFIRGSNPDEVISGYRKLTGKAPIMPKWSMGYWQSRERYKSRTELLDVLREYRKRQIPIDNIVLDWSYWPVDAWGSHEFDPKYFPDPKGMVDSVHLMNARIMISVWPKFYHTTDHYREFDNNGWMYRQAVDDSVRDWIGKGYIGSFYDPYSKGARELFWQQMKDHLYIHGFDAWWMDASEPDILSNASIEYRKKLSTPTALGPSTKYFNTYALLNAQGIYEGQREADPDRRVFLLTRSGFAGLQRYSTATWSGDIGTRWEDMKAQISAGLNFALSGIPYWTFDIGGFCVENRYTRAAEGSEDLREWRELNTRWFQFGAFCPLFRSHGQYPYREIFNISPAGTPAYKSMVYYNRLRYRLMPYIYSLAGMTWFNDYTIMRAMVMDFGSEAAVKSIGDQYMFGPSILVAPVYEYKARDRKVYFPSACGWYDFYSGQFIPGGRYLDVSAPYERLPLFVREGSIIPFGPEIEYTSQKLADPVTLFVYTGRNASFTLYEDEGVNYGYERGECTFIPFNYDEVSGELTIGERKGQYPGMLRDRTFNIVWVTRINNIEFDPDMKPHATLSYDGNPVVVKNTER